MEGFSTDFEAFEQVEVLKHQHREVDELRSAVLKHVKVTVEEIHGVGVMEHLRVGLWRGRERTPGGSARW